VFALIMTDMISIRKTIEIVCANFTMMRRLSFHRVIKAVLFLACFAVSGAAAMTGDETLIQVPTQIQDFRRKISYGKFQNTHDELDKKRQYAKFLEQVIKEVNEQVTKGNALSDEDIKSIGLFARLTVILRDDYVPSTFRGASGFEMKEVNATIHLRESVLQDFVPGIGKHLSLFQKGEKDWDPEKIAAWVRRFKEATGSEVK